MELTDFLGWILSGGGAGVLAYFLMDRIPALALLASESKRYVAFGLSALFAMLAFAGLVGLGVQPLPVSAVEWVNKLFLVATSAFALSQIIHARELR